MRPEKPERATLSRASRLCWIVLFSRALSDANRICRVKSWKIIADNLHEAGWSLGWVAAVDSEGRTIWIVDAHGYGKRFIVRSDELLTAFVELQRGIQQFPVSLML